MKGLLALIRRNVKIFFKDKGMFFSSLITPVILLVLYGTFLGRVYRENFLSAMPAGVHIPESLLNGLVGGQLISSILAVSCVTVAFCSNLLMIKDKTSGARHDLTITPVRPAVMAMGYYMASLLSTLIVTLTAAAVCLGYLSWAGWYLTAGDVAALLLDVLLLTMFGTALSSCINFWLTTDGQASAVGTIVSAGYGFICGAYMPMSNFGEGLQKVLSFLPGTYGTSLLRNHTMGGAFAEMERLGFPNQVVEAIRSSVDCNLFFFGHQVTNGQMYLILVGSTAVLMGLYVAFNRMAGRRTR